MENGGVAMRGMSDMNISRQRAPARRGRGEGLTRAGLLARSSSSGSPHGAVYGLAGTGLVLPTRPRASSTSPTGRIAALTVFVFYLLHDEHGWPWPLGGRAVPPGPGAPSRAWSSSSSARALEQVGATLKVVATVGLLLVVLGVGDALVRQQRARTSRRSCPTSTVPILGVNVGWDQIIVVIVSVMATGGPLLLLPLRPDGCRHARGRRQPGSRVHDRREPDTGAAVGLGHQHGVLPPWRACCSHPASASNAVVITMLVVQAFGAAAIGYFSNLPLTFAGGLAIGIAGSLADQVRRLDQLVERATRRPARSSSCSSSWSSPPRPAWPSAECVTTPPGPHSPGTRPGACACWPGLRQWDSSCSCRVPNLVATTWRSGRASWSTSSCFSRSGCSSARPGQISLCHLAFAAVGAAAFGHFADSYHLPVAAGAGAGDAGRRAGRGHRVDPGHPAVRVLPGAGHAGLRDPAAVALLYDQLDVRSDDLGHRRPRART